LRKYGKPSNNQTGTYFIQDGVISHEYKLDYKYDTDSGEREKKSSVNIVFFCFINMYRILSMNWIVKERTSHSQFLSILQETQAKSLKM